MNVTVKVIILFYFTMSIQNAQNLQLSHINIEQQRCSINISCQLDTPHLKAWQCQKPIARVQVSNAELPFGHKFQASYLIYCLI